MAEDGLPIHRILVLGDSFTGKTSFFRALTSESRPTEPPKPTYGCDVHVIPYKNVWFDCYELGGSHSDSHANHKVLAEDYAGYIFFFDANNIKSLANIPHFVSAINKASDYEIGTEEFVWDKYEPVAVIGCKFDLIDVTSASYTKVKKNLAKVLKQCKIQGAHYVETSAMHNKEENMKEFAPFLESVKAARRSESVKRKTPGREEVKENRYEKMAISMAHQKKEAKKSEEPNSIIGKLWSFIPRIRKLS